MYGRVTDQSLIEMVVTIVACANTSKFCNPNVTNYTIYSINQFWGDMQ
jgi:hypothetical protein